MNRRRFFRLSALMAGGAALLDRLAACAGPEPRLSIAEATYPTWESLPPVSPITAEQVRRFRRAIYESDRRVSDHHTLMWHPR